MSNAYLIFVIFFTLAKFLENKIYTEKRQFFALNLKKNATFSRKICRKCQFFCVKSVKMYTGQKKFPRIYPWDPWQISGMCGYFKSMQAMQINAIHLRLNFSHQTRWDLKMFSAFSLPPSMLTPSSSLPALIERPRRTAKVARALWARNASASSRQQRLVEVRSFFYFFIFFLGAKHFLFLQFVFFYS